MWNFVGRNLAHSKQQSLPDNGRFQIFSLFKLPGYLCVRIRWLIPQDGVSKKNCLVMYVRRNGCCNVSGCYNVY